MTKPTPDERERALAAIAFLIHLERREWPTAVILPEIRQDMRDLPKIHAAGIAAARNSTGPNRTKHPAGIRTTFPGADGCSVCEQREKAATANPKAARCPKTHCGRDLIPGESHECIDRNTDHRPNGWAAYQAFLSDVTAEQKRLRQAIANDPNNLDLAVANNRRIAELAAEIEVRANNIQPQAHVPTGANQ